MDRQSGHASAVIGKHSALVDCAQLLQECPGPSKIGGGRRIKETETGCFRASPCGEIQGQACEIGDEYFGRRVLLQGVVLLFRPEAVAHAWSLPAGAPSALIRRRAGNGAGDES